MDAKSQRITRIHGGVAAALSLIVQPIPAADEVLVAPIHYFLCLRLARSRKFPIAQLPWRAIQKIIWYGAVARLGVHLTIGMVPVAGFFVNAVTALALTEFLGQFVDGHIEHPGRAVPDLTAAELRRLFVDAIRARANEPHTVAPAAQPG